MKVGIIIMGWIGLIIAFVLGVFFGPWLKGVIGMRGA